MKVITRSDLRSYYTLNLCHLLSVEVTIIIHYNFPDTTANSEKKIVTKTDFIIYVPILGLCSSPRSSSACQTFMLNVHLLLTSSVNSIHPPPPPPLFEPLLKA